LIGASIDAISVLSEEISMRATIALDDDLVAKAQYLVGVGVNAD